MCGCGEPTAIAKQTRTAVGHVRGYPVRYRNGHNTAKFKYAPGRRFGRLTVVEQAPNGQGLRVRCRCDCGQETTVRAHNLAAGATRSCGCLVSDVGRALGLSARTHGHSNPETPTYRSWYAMVCRCRYPRNESWQWYGGRGVTVCDRWLGRDGFGNFLADMGERPQGTTLDRVNPEGNYEPSNCRWADAQTQATNKRAKS
jgi:ribosomal protein S27E